MVLAFKIKYYEKTESNSFNHVAIYANGMQ
jgi:hypothetical protein